MKKRSPPLDPNSDPGPEAWAAQKRLRFVERALFWRGQVKRRDLQAGFGISLAQASADLQRYFDLNPVAMITAGTCGRGVKRTNLTNRL